MFEAGQQVKGVYYGAAFTGTIISERWHTCRADLSVLMITLDAPITVFGYVRDDLFASGICLEVNKDGIDPRDNQCYLTRV